MKYSEYRAKAQSLDIVLFSGKGRISRAIKWATESNKSHVALTLHAHEYDCLALFESTTLSDIPDLVSDKPMKGAQLVNMSSRLKSYDGKVWVRQIIGPRTHRQKHLAMDVMREFWGRPYEQDEIELIRSALDIKNIPFLTNQPDASSVFCSELAAIMLRKTGILQEGQSPNEFTPADFERDLDLHKGYSLAEPVPIELD